MKRILTACSVIFILFALLASSPAQAASPSALDATSDHTITIDGTNDFSTDEDVAGTSGSTYYFTWNSSTFYFGAQNTDINDNWQYKSVQLYIDTDPFGTNGTSTGATYNNQTPTLPFSADYLLYWETDNTGMVLRPYSSGSWQTGNTTGVSAWQSGEYVEFSIGLSTIGSPAAVRVAAFMMNSESLHESIYYMTPSSNGPDGYQQNVTHYFGFLLKAGISPDWTCNIDTKPTGSNVSPSGYYNNTANWTSGVVPNDQSTHVIILNGDTITQDMSSAAKCVTIISGGTLTGGDYTLTLYGDWINNGSFGYGSSTNNEVKFVSTNHTIGGSQATTFYNLTIDGPDGDTPTVVNIGVEPFINGALVLDRTDDGKDAATANSIKLVQTLAVNDAEQKFLELTNSSGNTTKLDGVYVDTRADDSNLGNVTVEMTLRRYDTSSFDLDSCFGETAYNHSMRCYKLTSTAWPTGAKAKLTFWVPPAELGYLLPAYTLMVFHWMEENPAEPHTDFYWVSLDTPGVSGTNPYGVYGTTTSFSEFIVSDNNPTAVELVDLSARPASVPLAAPILLGAAAFLTGGILAFRKLRQR